MDGRTDRWMMGKGMVGGWVGSWWIDKQTMGKSLFNKDTLYSGMIKHHIRNFIKDSPLYCT